MLFRSFDMDWADDEMMRFFYDTVCKLDIYGTLNVTNDSAVLDVIRAEDRLELGIHPNFNGLLQNSQSAGSIETVIKELKQIVPESVSVRSHSLVTGSHIRKCFIENGLKYESNFLYTPQKGWKINCFQDYTGLIQVPFIFEDDVYLLDKIKKPATWYFDECEVPLVFNFHPIHLFLNTEDISRYEKCKIYYHDYAKLTEFRNTENNRGVLNVLYDIVSLANEREYGFGKMKDIEIDEVQYLL